MNTTPPRELAWINDHKAHMTSKERPPPNPPPKPSDDEGKTEDARRLIREFVETPPPKTMADIKAASDVYEANAEEQGSDGSDEKEKPRSRP